MIILRQKEYSTVNDCFFFLDDIKKQNLTLYKELCSVSEKSSKSIDKNTVRVFIDDTDAKNYFLKDNDVADSLLNKYKYLRPLLYIDIMGGMCIYYSLDKKCLLKIYYEDDQWLTETSHKTIKDILKSELNDYLSDLDELVPNRSELTKVANLLNIQIDTKKEIKNKFAPFKLKKGQLLQDDLVDLIKEIHLEKIIPSDTIYINRQSGGIDSNVFYETLYKPLQSSLELISKNHKNLLKDVISAELYKISSNYFFTIQTRSNIISIKILNGEIESRNLWNGTLVKLK